MNTTQFHHSLLHPTKVGDQWNQSTKENVDQVVEDVLGDINKHPSDCSINHSNETEHRRKKQKHENIMDESVSTIMT